jgi:hypothetical protein
MSFLPYTLMNAGYVVIGSMLASTVHWDRVAVLVVVYVLAVGISAHALDAMGPNKPWGSLLSNRQFAVLAVSSLIPALALGAAYSILYAPWLLVVGTAELFFLFAYNLELFHSRFHSEGWFAFSWGFLPVVAGYVVQTDGLSVASLAGGLFGLATAYLEANASRPYKLLKSGAEGQVMGSAERFEKVLKGVVGSVLAVALTMVTFRVLG